MGTSLREVRGIVLGIPNLVSSRVALFIQSTMFKSHKLGPQKGSQNMDLLETTKYLQLVIVAK